MITHSPAQPEPRTPGGLPCGPRHPTHGTPWTEPLRDTAADELERRSALPTRKPTFSNASPRPRTPATVCPTSPPTAARYARIQDANACHANLACLH